MCVDEAAQQDPRNLCAGVLHSPCTLECPNTQAAIAQVNDHLRQCRFVGVVSDGDSTVIELYLAGILNGPPAGLAEAPVEAEVRQLMGHRFAPTAKTVRRLFAATPDLSQLSVVRVHPSQIEPLIETGDLAATYWCDDV